MNENYVEIMINKTKESGDTDPSEIERTYIFEKTADSILLKRSLKLSYYHAYEPCLSFTLF